MLSYLINIGIKESMSRQLIRQIKLTNILIMILIGFGIVLFVPILIENGFNSSAYIDLFSIGLMFLLLWLNNKGYINATRLIISFYPPLTIISATILIKLTKPENVVVFDFFDGRILLVGLFIIPFLLFSHKEKKLLFAALTFPFLLVFLFDPIHNMFGIGYMKFFGSMPNSYIVSGIYIDIALIFLAGSVYYFKASIESLLQKNYLLADGLSEKNMELSALLEEVERTTQVLEKNKIIINEQKNLLEKSNTSLFKQVEQKTIELKQSNEELIRHNNELQQFSNTLSHNLRSPVANLLGLSVLFKMDKSEKNRTNVANHIFKSAEALDGVIKDLNKVIELRNNLFQIKEKIEIENELDSIWQVLGSSVEQSKAKLVLDINTSVIYGVRSYFHSIIYNLISNAIKYRHTERDCLIRVNTYSGSENITIEVLDNGIGVDLDKYQDNIFGMYKRFHDHLEGKGLGLFLAKQQVEAMKGSISIESKLNIGTKFIINFPNIPLSQIQSQLFFKSEVADIYLDAVNKITILLWKKMPNPIEFKDVFINNMEVFSAYHSDKWIVDLSLMIRCSAAEKQWILGAAIDQYVNAGIKQVAVVRVLVDEDKSFWDDFHNVSESKSTTVVFANSIEGAKEKLMKL